MGCCYRNLGVGTRTVECGRMTNIKMGCFRAERQELVWVVVWSGLVSESWDGTRSAE